MDRVAIHRGVVRARNIEWRAHVVGDDLSHGVQQRPLLRLQQVEVREDALPGFLNRDHR
ncbi:MAG: hypothetical protein U5Q44_14835 [Dehalococcoidia bacterium]|nr:hypothetical protein [Dehalococcoidia bacterium]